MSKDLNDGLKKLILKLHPTARSALLYLYDNKDKSLSNPPQEIITGAQLLEQEELTKVEIKQKTVIQLDTLGEQFLKQELPEYQVLKKLQNASKTLSQLGLPQEIVTAALGELKRQQLVEIKKEKEMVLTPTTQVKVYLDKYNNPLKIFVKVKSIDELKKDEEQIAQTLMKRKGFLKKSQHKEIFIQLTKKGLDIAKILKDEFENTIFLESLTSDMLKAGSWKNNVFRHYEMSIPTTPKLGRLHPMIEANDILTDIFVEMGFKEMEGPIVESEFWCFDALWIPQDHPAREDQDTFYIGDQADVDPKLIEKVKYMHENGIDKTHTPIGDFKESITRNTILRTHSTATTFRTLHDLGEKFKKGEDIDGKYFYVAHNFRNEAVDATHLAEFFQVEGILIADDLSLAGLIGFMKEFYAKLGLHKLKFKPTFNPYTEPSMEIHYFDDKMDKWYSIGNSGIFRPETLKAFGLEGKRIYGFGLGASRVATLLTQKSNMREITGATCDFEWIKTHKALNRKILR